MASQPCKECGVRPKMTGRHRCLVCQTRHLDVQSRVEASTRRLGMVPPELRRRVVPARLWPAGQRWCGGCQSFCDLVDFGKSASQCKACVSSKTHSKMVAKTYGIDGDRYAELLTLQGGRCAICRARPRKTRLAVDHDHKTGVVRGLLCSRCNHELLGAGWDSRAVLEAAVAYLDTPPATGLWRAPEVAAIAETVKTSRLVDPVQFDRPDAKPLPTSGTLTPGALAVLGGGRDERGFYRLYIDPADTRIPF